MSLTNSPSADALATETWVITPDTSVGVRQRLAEAWRYRRIVWFFGSRAILKMHAKTKLGWPWVIIRTLMPLWVGSLVYGGVMQVDSGPHPYFLFLLVGSIAWSFFDSPLSRASRGLEMNRGLIRKLYLPRMILPLTQMFAGLVEPVINIFVLIGSVIYYHHTRGIWYITPGPRLIVAVLAAALALALATACGLWTSIWQARARDFKFILAYVIGFWYFVTPVVYPVSTLPPMMRAFAMLNPMTGPVEGFKWGVLSIGEFPALALLCSFVVTFVVGAGGFWYFQRAETATTDQL